MVFHISIKVADSIMGSGKTSAVINLINSNPEKKFIYIAPYLTEAKRIRDSCKQARFVEPSNKLEKFDFKKLNHTAELLRSGRNIASTHQLFRSYTPEMLEIVREQEYTLIIDESVDVLNKVEIHPDDMRMAVDGGYIKVDGDEYTLTGKQYDGSYFSEMFSLMKLGSITRACEDDDTYFFWIIPTKLLTSFKDVYICTYLFEGQSLHHLLELSKLPYEYIGVHKEDDGEYRFGDYPGHTPEYVRELKNKIHILDHRKLNDIGDDYHALSMSWYSKEGNASKLRKHIANFFMNIAPAKNSKRRLWTTYTEDYGALRGKGYTKSFLTFNARAMNEYSKCDSLVYAVNPFQNVVEQTFFIQRGVKVDRDLYSLSVMVQWIWRSAIRNGEEIYIYIPSRRMRELLVDWINSFENIGEIYE